MISGVSVSCVILCFLFLEQKCWYSGRETACPCIRRPQKRSSGLGGPLPFLRENQDLKNAIPVPTTLEKAKLFYNSSNNRKNVYL